MYEKISSLGYAAEMWMAGHQSMISGLLRHSYRTVWSEFRAWEIVSDWTSAGEFWTSGTNFEKLRSSAVKIIYETKSDNINRVAIAMF